MENERCHVTVVGARRRVDLAVPAHAAIAEYTPTLLGLVGQVEFDETFPPVWSLALPGAPPFSPEASLRESGVADGATLYLRDAAVGEFDEPVVTDLEESVGKVGDDVAVWGWRPRAYTTLVLGILTLIAGFVTLTWSDVGATIRPATGVGAMVVAFSLTLLTWHATRQRWSLPLGLRLIIAYSAVPLLAVAAASVPVATVNTGSMLLALSVGGVIGALAGLLAVRHATTLMAVAITVLALVLTASLTLGQVTLLEASAVVAITMMAVLGAAPKAAGHFAVLAGPDSGGADAYADEAGVLHLVKRGQRLLIGTNTLGSLVVAACLMVLGSAHQSFAVALTGCLGLTLILRAGRLTIAAAVVPLVAAGTIGLATAVIKAPGNFGAPIWTGPVALLGAAVLALAFGLSRVFRADATEERPSWIDPLAGFFLVISVPLAVGVFGVYTSLLHSGQTP
ncbi:type VII secretion integral membrane protein EccD [Streptomyces sp. NBC_01217]|uniref:type VII secretion integral membrane protein EccD n=1 Tax=Streptomyces sp. NBC_01217 TaxID=2903779 RepID=UPI002E143D34|nr:type VII secretion integral membrane protein EccD [Streptomyces sp. NBC_01217]WSQ62545.1 type VII secretion integral membrane protein EccD [Streptomyces sp. NBC_01217]